MDLYDEKFDEKLKKIKSESGKKNIELEARFKGDINERKINNFLSLANFDGFEIKDTLIIDYFTKDGKRISYYDNKYFDTTKTIIEDKFYDEGKLKISISKEEKREVKGVRSYEYTREKERKSFIKDNFSLDITKVKNSKNNNFTFEIELEVIDFDKVEYREFLKKTIFFYTSITYEIEEINLFYNRIFNKNTKFNRGINKYISKPRDLKIPDLKNNGLLRNYTASPKADGELYFLIYHYSGVWLISPKKYKKIALNYSDKIMVFAGELLTKDNMKIKKNFNMEELFLAFDCLYHDENISKKNYNERIKYLITDNIYLDEKFLLKVEKKEIIFLGDTVDEYYKNMKKIFSILEGVKYKEDGIIFTPVFSPYITEGQIEERNIKRSARVLSNYKDVCKFKLILSIDFYYSDKKLFILDGDNLIPFKGTERYPFTEDNFIVDKPLKLRNKIIEFYPHNDGKKIVYKNVRVRNDKKTPNNITVATQLWELAHNPVTEETLKGENITLLRKFNNQIKERIIKDIKGVVLDIGAGNGGDLLKYKSNNNISKVLAIEPNSEFVEEYINRAKKMKLNPDKFIEPLNCGGEESEKIKNYFHSHVNKNEEVNVVMMLSLSFFWSEGRLKKLVETINMLSERVNIYYFTIIGSRVKDLFERLGDTVKLNTITLKYINDEDYFVDIDDSVTVFKQTEHYVNIQEMKKLLNATIEYSKTPLSDLPDDYILSKGEKIYNTLFEYGKMIAVREKSIILPTNSLEDEYEELNNIGEGMFRIYNPEEGDDSLYYSILYLTNKNFRESDEKDKYMEKFKSKISMLGENILHSLPYNVRIYDKYGLARTYNDYQKYIILFHTHNKYESVIKIEDNEEGDDGDIIFIH